LHVGKIPLSFSLILFFLFSSSYPHHSSVCLEATRIDAEEIYKQTSRQLKEGTTLYVATDEHNQTFFDPLRAHYDLVFLNDFQKELGDLNTNYYGMVDQLISTRGETFFGCWFSTFTGYITRLRGMGKVRQRT
jgi:GDP-fucose protein O-fucosyltransferase